MPQVLYLASGQGKCDCFDSTGRRQLYLLFALRRSAQYFFIRALTAFLADADIFLRFRRAFGTSASRAATAREAALVACRPLWRSRCEQSFTSLNTRSSLTDCALQ